MKKLFNVMMILCIMISFVVQTAKADGYEQAEKINSIIGNSEYLYAEHYSVSEQEAKTVAQEILEENINEWVGKKTGRGSAYPYVDNSKRSLFMTITHRSGTLTRVFVYVKKSDILPRSASEVRKVGLEEYASGVESRVTRRQRQDTVNPEVLKILSTYKEYKPMAEKLVQLKNEGKIEKYARYSKLDNPDDYYLVIYNTAGKIQAILSQGEERYNILTDRPDRVLNYSGCGAIGFK